MIRTRIIVPCFNEEARLDVDEFRAFVEAHDEVGFVFVNDGSSDGTLQVLNRFASEMPRIAVLDRQPNAGKAEAVRHGILVAIELGAEFVGFWDADLATPLDAIPVLVDVLLRRPDIEIVLGSRVSMLGRRIERSPHRHYLGRVFATVASLVLDFPVYDTQCGAKVFRATPRVAACFAEPFDSRWIFDVEILARYVVGGGCADSLFEQPLDRWRDVGGSKVKGRDFVRAAGEMITIYRNYPTRRLRGRLVGLLTSRFVRYVVVGALGTVVHYSVLVGAVEFVGVEPTRATVAGAIAGAIVNYLLNYHLTFSSEAPHVRTIPKFAAVAALGVALNAFGMHLLRERAGLHYLVAQLISTFAVLLLGFLANREWTFRGRGERREPRVTAGESVDG